MAVLGVLTVTVKPGKWDAQIDILRQLKALLERSGARNVRAWTPFTANSVTTVVLGFEVDDFEAYGRVMNLVFADPFIPSAFAEARGEDGNVSAAVSSILIEVPL